jgi:hypothetical protein
VSGIGRKTVAIITALLSVLLLSFAVMMFACARPIERSFNEAKKLPESSFVVDMSKVGVYEGPVANGYMTGHQRRVYLQVESETIEPKWLETLQGTCTLVSDRDAGSVSDNLGSNYRSVDRPGMVEIWRVAPWDVGDYRLRIEVTTPVPELAGRVQRVIVDYQFCGLEVLPARIMQAVGIMAAMPGLILAAFACKLAFQRNM